MRGKRVRRLVEREGFGDENIILSLYFNCNYQIITDVVFVSNIVSSNESKLKPSGLRLL